MPRFHRAVEVRVWSHLPCIGQRVEYRSPRLLTGHTGFRSPYRITAVWRPLPRTSHQVARLALYRLCYVPLKHYCLRLPGLVRFSYRDLHAFGTTIRVAPYSYVYWKKQISCSFRCHGASTSRCTLRRPSLTTCLAANPGSGVSETLRAYLFLSVQNLDC